jgi:hypothetical protein
VKHDFKKTLDGYRAKAKVVRLIEVPPLQYLMLDGHGDPNSAPAYAAGIAALYPVAYALKFASKHAGLGDYVVMPLEALWWSSDMATFTTSRDKSRWSWTLLNMVPDWITDAMFRAAVDKVGKGADAPAALHQLRLERLSEGLSAQTLHVGSYDDEGPVIAALHDVFIPAHGCRLSGKHHEIYLSDARRVEPAKLKTILRQPVVRL